jgi:phosphopantetheine--protein transferase-like protein
MLEMSQGLRQSSERGIGIDVQLISELNTEDSDFVNRNFTENEIEYCKSAGNKEQIKSRFAGRWAAKEAVIKAISNCVKDTEKTAPLWKGSAAALKGIEILPTGYGPVMVKLYEHAADVARVLGVNQVKVTISHSGEYAVAHAVAQ